MRTLLLILLLCPLLTAVDEWRPHQHPASIVRELNSYTEAIHTLELHAEVTARVMDLPLDVGDSAETGQFIQLDERLAHIDLQTARARQAQVKAQVTAAEAALELASDTASHRQSERQRFEKLIASDSVSDERYDAVVFAARQAEHQLAQQRAHLVQQQESLNMAKADILRAKEVLARHRVTIPAGWTVTRRYTEVAALAHPNTPLLQLQDLRTLVMRFSLSEAELLAFRQQQEITVTLPVQKQNISCSVKSINPAYNPLTRKRELTLQAPAKAFKEASGGIACVLHLQMPDPNQTLLIPRSFINTRFEQDRVRLQDNSWLPILVMRHDGDMAVVQARQFPEQCVLIKADAE